MTEHNSFFQYWTEFLLAMTKKEIRARYKNAVLGFLWMVLNPLLQMIVIGLIFQFFIEVSVDNYFIFLFAGLLPWNFFAYTLNKTTPLIVYERFLIKKARFPREHIVLSVVLSNLIHMLTSLLLFVIFLIGYYIIFGNSPFQNWGANLIQLLVLLPTTIWLFVFTAGLSLLTSTLNVRYRDVTFIVKAIVPLWFYATPIVYEMSLLPHRVHTIIALNPLTTITQLFRFSLMNHAPPGLTQMLLTLLLTLVTTGLGAYAFFKKERYFDDWL